MAVVNENSKTMCANCDEDLATHETVWAAQGILYCSRECGITDFTYVYGSNAEAVFDNAAEEINPIDIGLREEDRV